VVWMILEMMVVESGVVCSPSKSREIKSARKRLWIELISGYECSVSRLASCRSPP
jgi:hypothetical protein